MELIKENGDILKLSPSEYKELFMEEQVPKQEYSIARRKNKHSGFAKDHVKNIVEHLKLKGKEIPFKKLTKKFKIPNGGSSAKVLILLRNIPNLDITKRGKTCYLIYTAKMDQRVVRGQFIGNRTRELMKEGQTRTIAWNKATKEWAEKRK